MELYYAVYIDRLDDICKNGLGVNLGDADILPIRLEFSPHKAEARQMIYEYKCGANSFSEIVVLYVNILTVEDEYLEPITAKSGDLIGYYYGNIIDSNDISIFWADMTFPLNEFVCLYKQVLNHGFAADKSESLMKCIQWFVMGVYKRNAIFGILGHWITSHISNLSVLTGYTIDQLRALWFHRERTMELFVIHKESYETALILSMCEAGCSIEDISKKVNWQLHEINEVLQSENSS